MDDMDDFYKQVQKLLMRKNQECGELQFLVSRTTDDNVRHIDDICKSIRETFHKCDIPVEGNDLTINEKSVQAYKYLMLNTSLKNQERLGEDITNGHLVDMCPPLSSYLLIQILWNLGYEKILVKSLSYLPIDVCAELLEVMRKCLEELPFERSIDIIFESILNVYRKFISLTEDGLQSTNIKESVTNLLANFQELTLALINPKITRLKELPGLKRYERCGFILKKVIRTTKDCLESKKPILSTDLDKLYKISFGREPYVKCDSTLIDETMNTLNQELLSLLLKKIKEIDCNIYLGWAELDDDENNTISLQRSIGNDCYYFLQLISKNEKLSEDTHLMECLQQLSSKPDSQQSGYVLSLQELCHAVKEGKKEHVKDLMCRYREWDETVLDFLYKNRSLLDKDDCLTLLEYLTFVLVKSDREDFKRHCYPLVTKIILLQSIPDIYEIATEYIVKHNGKNHLESPHTEEVFRDFITRTSNLRTPKNLRIILLFLMKNPKMVLTTLLKITIGHPDYGNIIISPGDLLLLLPFMSIREENNRVLFTSIFRTICIENAEWNMKKFSDLVQLTLENTMIKVDDLMNNVFIPYLEADSFTIPNINCILIVIRKLRKRCTENMNVKGLIIALTKKMSYLRRNKNIPKYSSSETLGYITTILKYFLDVCGYRINVQLKREIAGEIESFVEPIDKFHLASLWHKGENDTNIIDTIEDYERRCFLVMNKVRNYSSDLSFLREDFLRHLIMRSTYAEYQRFASELTFVYWFVFGWSNEIDAYNNFLRVTIEACCLSLEYPSVGPSDLFLFLVKSYTRFCNVLVNLKGMTFPDEVYESLIRNTRSLDSSIKHSPYADLFTVLLGRLNDDARPDTQNLLQDVLNMLDRFVDQCFELDQKDNKENADLCHSPKISNFFLIHEMISACLKVPASGAYECVRRMNELLATN